MHFNERASRAPAAAVRAWLEEAEARGWARPKAGETEAIDQAIEEIEVAEHELRAQNEELLATTLELENERSRYLELFEAAPDAYFVTDNLGMIRRANRAAHELIGAAAGRLEGKPLAICIAEEDRGAFRSHIVRLGRLERLTNWKTRLESRDGESVPVLAHAVPAPVSGPAVLEIRWLIRDLRVQHSADEARRRLRQEHAARMASERAAEQAGFLAVAGRAFLEVRGTEDMARRIARHAAPRLADACIVFLRDDGRLRCTAVHHQDPEQAADMSRDLIGVQVDPDILDGPARIARDGGLDMSTDADPEFLARCLGRGEPARWMASPGMSLLLPLRERGHVRGVLWLLNDRGRPPDPECMLLAEAYADRAMAALHTSVIHDELLRARDEAARANAEKARAFATLSHDFRTPLAAVLGYTDLMLDGIIEGVPEKAIDWIRRIRASTEHQLALVDQLLMYTRLESGRVQVVYETADLSALATSTAELFRRQAELSGLELRVRCPVDEVLARIDPGKVRQVLTNLLSNALRFTEEGHVGIALDRDGSAAILSVFDTGVGIGAEALRHVFERFWQGGSNQPDGPNVGLGLAIARDLTHLMNGSIEVESAPGAGTTFRVRLPGVVV